MIEIKVKTIYDEENIKKFLKIHYFDRTSKVRIIINILIIFVVVSFFMKENKSIINYIVLVFCLFGVIELNTNMLPNLSYLRLKRKKNSLLNTKLEYTFKKNNFKIKNINNEYIDYNTLYQVIETKTNYYLYINKFKSFIVDKKDIKEEDINTLTSILKEKVSTYKYKENV